MASYRLYLQQHDRIVGRQDFSAENDEAARAAAALVLEACNGQCHGWELWDGSRLVGDNLTAEFQALEARTMVVDTEWMKTALERSRKSAARASASVQETAAYIEERLLEQGRRPWHGAHFAQRGFATRSNRSLSHC